MRFYMLPANRVVVVPSGLLPRFAALLTCIVYYGAW